MNNKDITVVINFIYETYSKFEPYAKAFIYHADQEILNSQLIEFIHKNNVDNVPQYIDNFYHEFSEYGQVNYMHNREITSNQFDYFIRINRNGRVELSYNEVLYTITHDKDEALQLANLEGVNFNQTNLKEIF